MYRLQNSYGPQESRTTTKTMIKVLQINLNCCKCAQELMMQTASFASSVRIISE